MEYQKYLKYFCLLILSLCTVVIYFLLTNHYTLVLRSLNIPYTSVDLYSSEILLINQTNNNFTFESRVSDYYPRLPIHIFTQNLSFIDNTSKLILIGNGFFGDRDWGIAKPNRSSREISTNIELFIL
jgi:hypothetical protein